MGTNIEKSEFRSLLLGAQRSLFSFAIKLTSNRDSAEDLVQDTTLKALVNEEKYADGTNFKGWVMTIMRNIFLNDARRMERTVMVDEETSEARNAVMCMMSDIPEPDSVYNEQQISAFVKALPDGYRIPFTMSMAGYSYEEIAKKMGETPGVVKSRLFHTRKRMREIFADMI